MLFRDDGPANAGEPLILAAAGKLTLLGNLNGVTMRRWTAEQAEAEVKAAIAAAAPGGGFILADNHGEIPFQVPDEVLHAIGAARAAGAA